MAGLAAAKVFPASAEVDARGRLWVGGCDTVELAREYGTPLYVYDEGSLRGAAEAFKSAFASRYAASQVVYACKAFINVPLARLIASYGLGFDVVSGGEAAVLRAAGVSPEGVYFHGNNKSPQELSEAVEWGIGHVVVDSFFELEELERIAAEAGVVQPVLVRVSPSIDPHTHRYTTTGVLDSKFGFAIETGHAEQAVRQATAAPHLDLQGLHFHLGSPIFELEPYAEGVAVVMEFASRMREEGLEMRRFSPGGGFAIAYTEDDDPPTADAYAEAIVGALRQACRDYDMPEPELVIEPGRAVVGPAGVALYTVGAIKEIPGVRTYVAVDGGMGDNIRPALYGARYVAAAANRAHDPATETVTVAGKYCESGDVLIRDARLPALRAGDLLAIPASGAYGPSMASDYNLNGRPPIVLVGGGAATLLRRRESYDDLMATDVR